MKVLITGGSGFLGFHMANKLLKEGHEVVLYDIADYTPEDYIGEVTFIKGDVRDYDNLKETMKNVDAVVHAAAALPLWKPYDIFSTNVQGTALVLKAAETLGVKRVVYISSTAVYGIPDKVPMEEDDPLEGVGPYGESKIMAEKICEAFRKEGMIVPVIRPKTFIGTGRLGVFEILFDWVKDGKKIPVIGNGKNRYQLLDVEDLTDAIYLTLVEDEEKVNDTFNVGAERFMTVEEELMEFFRAVGSKSRVMKTPARLVKALLRWFEKMGWSPLYEWVYGTADHDSYVSIEKIKKKLGWTPKRSNAEALINAYRWYEKHYEEIKGRVGVTHRVAWKQGILKVIKWFM